MANVFFDNPPILSGTQDQKLQQLYNHLFNVSNKLNDAFVTITIEETRAEEQRKAAAAAQEQQGAADSDFIKAKSLIIKTAELVRTEMQEIRTTLTGSIDALSDQFGNYQQTITQEIIEQATGILQSFRIEERISGVEGAVGDFIRSQTSYIYAGILDDTTMTTGIAIGEGVTDENGELVEANRVVQITSDRIALYQNGAEVAYFSNNSFYISKGIVTDGLQMGNFQWKVFSNGSLGLMKV